MKSKHFHLSLMLGNNTITILILAHVNRWDKDQSEIKQTISPVRTRQRTLLDKFYLQWWKLKCWHLCSVGLEEVFDTIIRKWNSMISQAIGLLFLHFAQHTAYDQCKKAVLVYLEYFGVFLYSGWKWRNILHLCQLLKYVARRWYQNSVY